MEGLGERLREIRKRAGKEQMDIARAVLGGEATVKKLKSFANRISQIERGRGGNPSLQFLEQIATGLGLTISGLFLQIEGLPAGAQPASITDTPKPIEAAGAPIPADDSAFAARMVSLCLTAAELSDRDATRAGLEELAVAFAMAAPAGLAQETKNKVKSRRPPRRQAS